MGLFLELFKSVNQHFVKQQQVALSNQYDAYVQAYSQSTSASPHNNLVSQNTKAFITNASFSQNFATADGWAAESAVITKPMHVMMLGLRGFPNVEGGIETHAEHLAPLLVKLGCNLEVIVRSPYQSTNTSERWNGVRFTM